MKNYDIYGYGFGTFWQDVCVYRKEAYSTSVSDFHQHDFYEINFILSGNVKALIKNKSKEGKSPKIVLTKPGDAHFVSCLPDTLYSRIYLVFTREFIENGSTDWIELLAVFGTSGAIITLDDESCAVVKEIMDQISRESAPLCKKTLIYYLLSRLAELKTDTENFSNSTPAYIFEALSYLENHSEEKIVASELAARLHIGRTALLTSFKKHIGLTLGEYLDDLRIRRATKLISRGEKLDSVAEACGFSDTSGLIRCFKRHYSLTPLQYVKSLKN